ncbi:MAG: hypothetical protein PHH23_01505 [Paludibacteraceae bacterium]|nr:hypothetical protein [Paludibacteraceae bacterium]
MTRQQYTNIINIYKSYVNKELDVDMVKQEHLAAQLELDKKTVAGDDLSDVTEYLSELNYILGNNGF